MGISLGWRIPQFPTDGSNSQDFVTQIVHSLELLGEGFDSAWLEDHMLPGPRWQNPETDSLEGWTTINYFMGKFERLSFGHIVLCNSYRNPALLAKMVATLCSLAPGRFILGMGAGWKENEYVSYGYEFPNGRTRIDALSEAIQIIRKMWTENVVSFNGKYYKISGAYCNPKPNPIPPIMIGGGGERLTLRTVAEHADWWNGVVNLEDYKHKLDVLRSHCNRIGRDYESIKKTWLGCIAITETEDEAIRLAKNNPFPTREPTISGTPEQVSQKLKEFVDIGVEYLILRFLDFPSTTGTKLFTENVATQFR
ncbi:MAG TPA: LLM class flavin-dependent oxidoreductase [Candidatus Bathyarchaeia archaeon]|nr:LLM class flavin-dependent oxidoreductase [Candidatus Bathyarchaeia archaeon]